MPKNTRDPTKAAMAAQPANRFVCRARPKDSERASSSVSACFEEAAGDETKKAEDLLGKHGETWGSIVSRLRKRLPCQLQRLQTSDLSLSKPASLLGMAGMAQGSVV